MSEHELVESFIATYGAGRLGTLKLLVRYVLERNRRFGNKSFCATYEGVRKWMTYARIRRKFTTVERDIRALASRAYEEEPPVRRIPKHRGRAKDVIFCLNTEHPIVQYLMEAMEHEGETP